MAEPRKVYVAFCATLTQRDEPGNRRLGLQLQTRLNVFAAEDDAKLFADKMHAVDGSTWVVTEQEVL